VKTFRRISLVFLILIFIGEIIYFIEFYNWKVISFSNSASLLPTKHFLISLLLFGVPAFITILSIKYAEDNSEVKAFEYTLFLSIRFYFIGTLLISFFLWLYPLSVLIIFILLLAYAGGMK
jgi:hypothetical protein